MDMSGREDIKLFMRDCWNNATPADEFFEKVREQYSQKDIQFVGLHLLTLIGRANRQATFVLSYVSRLLINDPIFFISAIHDSDICQVTGLTRMIASIGDTMFDNLEVGSEIAAQCAVRALKLVMSNEDRRLVTQAVKKLAMSPNFAILVASGRIYCKSEFARVAAEFKDLRPLGDDRNSTSHPALVTALTATTISNTSVILSHHLGIVDLYAFTAHMWKVSTKMNDLYMPVVKKDVLRHMIRRYISAPSLVLAFAITNLCVGVLKPEYVDANGRVEREALKCMIQEMHDEDEAILRTQMYSESNSTTRGLEIVSPFPEEMSVDDAVALFTETPSSIKPERMLDQALKYPAIAQDVGPLFLSLLRIETVDKAVLVIDHVMKRARDFRILLAAQKILFDVEKALADLVLRVTDETTFQKLWFFLLFLFYTAENCGAKSIIDEVTKFSQSCEKPVQLALSVFHWENEIDLSQRNASFTFETFEFIPTMVEKCHEFVLLLSETLDMDSAVRCLEKHPYLWPSALMWTMKTAHPGAHVFLTTKAPSHKLVNTMLKHVSVCLRDPTKTWNSVLENPSFEVCRRFGPKSIQELHMTLPVEIGFLASINEIQNKFARRIVIAWRAWISLFGIAAFIDSLLEILLWTVQVGRDPYFAINCFRCVACALVMICNDNGELNREIIHSSMKHVTTELCSGIAGSGIAEFCIIVAMGSHDNCSELFAELLEFRKKLLEDGADSRSAQVGYCTGLIKAGIYLPLVRQITPDVFDKLMVKHEWQAAIDYFLIRSQE